MALGGLIGEGVSSLRDIVRLREQKEKLVTSSTTPLAKAFRSLLTDGQQLVFDEVICKNDYTQETTTTLAETLECSRELVVRMHVDLRWAFYACVASGTTDIPVVKAVIPKVAVAYSTGRPTLHKTAATSIKEQALKVLKRLGVEEAPAA